MNEPSVQPGRAARAVEDRAGPGALQGLHQQPARCGSGLVVVAGEVALRGGCARRRQDAPVLLALRAPHLKRADPHATADP